MFSNDDKFNLYTHKKGIFFTDGPEWKEQRRFTLRHLRDYGFGRRFETLECEIRDEIAEFINIIKEGPKYEHEKVFKFNGFFNLLKKTCYKTIFLAIFQRGWLHKLSNSIFHVFGQLFLASAFRSSVAT